MITYLLYVASALGAIMTITGFLAYVSKPFRMWIRRCIKKTIKDDEQDIMIKAMHENIKSILNQNDLMREANLSLIRDNITRAYYKFMEKNEIPSYIRESLVKQYDSYHSMKGNSYIDIIMPEILEIPVKH